MLSERMCDRSSSVLPALRKQRAVRAFRTWGSNTSPPLVVRFRPHFGRHKVGGNQAGHVSAGLPAERWHDVAVGIERDRDRRMAKQVLYDLGMHPFGQNLADRRCCLTDSSRLLSGRVHSRTIPGPVDFLAVNLPLGAYTCQRDAIGIRVGHGQRGAGGRRFGV